MFSRSAVRLVQAYLTGRSQVVHVNGELSDNIDIISGVPQGSILGPLLFTMFINDLPSVLKHCKIHMFADDVQIYLYATDLSVSEMSLLLNEDLSRIFSWSTRNLLPTNAAKTKVMLITRNRGTTHYPHIVMGDAIIDYVEKNNSSGFRYSEQP